MNSKCNGFNDFGGLSYIISFFIINLVFINWLLLELREICNGLKLYKNLKEM